MRKLYPLPLLLLAVLLPATSASAQATGKRPVIIIPGITGSKLVDASGDTVWFSTKRNKEDDLRLPIRSPNLRQNRDGLRAVDIIREVELTLLPDVEVYQSVIDALKGKGYSEATWDAPKASDVFYVFAYDWRRDNVESAHLLMRKMAAAKRALKRPDLKFDILAHSMGGLLARYAAMYGLADLPREGAAPRPNWQGSRHVAKILMFGTPNEGALSAFEALLKGYPIILDRKLPFVDDLRAEDVFATPSIYQLLPHSTSARFYDEHLRPVRVDLFDPREWLKYGWGALSQPKFLSKLKDAPRLARTNPEIKPEELSKDAGLDDRLVAQTTYAQAYAYFASALSRAERFTRALDVPLTHLPVDLYAYGGNCEETIDGVLLIQDKEKQKWETRFEAKDLKTADGTEIDKNVVKTAMYSIGDGRVTQRSLLAAPQMIVDGKPVFGAGAFPVKASFFGCSSHTKLFLDKPIQDSFLSALVVETQKQP